MVILIAYCKGNQGFSTAVLNVTGRFLVYVSIFFRNRRKTLNAHNLIHEKILIIAEET